MLQTVHQSHAYRLVTYHDRRDTLPYFPAFGFGDKVIELLHSDIPGAAERTSPLAPAIFSCITTSCLRVAVEDYIA
jgi:hypothetical protein